MSSNVTSPSLQHHRLTRPASSIISRTIPNFSHLAKGHLVFLQTAHRWAATPAGVTMLSGCTLQGEPMVPPAPLPFPRRTSASASLRSETQKQRTPARAQPLRLKWTVGTDTSRHHRSSPYAGTPGYAPPRRRSAMATVGKAGGRLFSEEM